MKPGEIYLVRFPFTDGSAAKLRPVLVISSAQYNKSDVVVLPISSRPKPSDKFSVYIGDPSYREAGLRLASAIKWTKPMTIARSVFQRRLGELPQPLLQDALAKLKDELLS